MIDKIWDGLNTLTAWLCQAIYPLIAYLYRIFYNLGDLRIINSEDIDPIYNRVTLILGLAMLFFVVFQLIQYIIEPDNFSDKEKGLGKVMFRMIISVVLIGLVPKIFDLAFELQHDILENNLIPKIILGTESNYNEEWGGYFSASILDKFYTVNPNVTNYECTSSNKHSAKDVVSANITSLREDGSLETLGLCLNDKASDQDEYVIKFDGIFAVLAGGVVVWMLAIYCLDLGTRVIQLTYLQVIAPIPIIMYMLPKKDGAFEKWVKQCITTFLDLFIRTAIICLVVLVISTLNSSFENITNNISSSGQGDKMFTALIYVCLVLGIMTFAKKAGDMLKELFPKGNAASGDLGISPKRMPEPIKRVTGAGKGLVAAGAVGLANRAASNIKFARRNKETKANLKNRLDSEKASYREAMKIANDSTKSQEVRNRARNQAKTHKKEIASINNDLKKYSTGRLIGGVATGTLYAANQGMMAGLTSKEGKGAVSKATKAVIQHNKAIDEWRENGGTSFTGRVTSGIQQSLGINPTAKYDLAKEKIDAENAAYDQYDKYMSSAEDRAAKLISEGKYEKASDETKRKATEAREAKNLAEIYRTQAGNLKLSDFGNDEEKFKAKVKELNEEAIKQDNIAISAEKEARVSLIQDIMNGNTDMKDEVISQSVSSAQTVIKSNSGLDGFADAVFDSFEKLKDLNNKAKAKKSDNVNELYTMQKSEDYKSAQANKKYNEEGKK